MKPVRVGTPTGAHVLVLSTLVIVAAMAVHAPCLAGARQDDPFPGYPGLAGHVGFWRSVFAEWDVDQVVVHDLDHPAVVYQVVALPGTVEFPYTKGQREFVEDLREAWEETLERLERKVDAREPLSDEEKALALKLTTRGGTDAVRDAHRRVRTQRGLRARFKRGLEIGGRYVDEFRRIFRENGLPEDLAYLPHVESSFQWKARSSAGAVGIWQFTRGTGRHFLKIDSSLDERLDPVAATVGAARYFEKAYGELGSWPLAITSYNHGLQGMRRAKQRFGDDFERIVREYEGRSFGFASKNFYAEFLAAREIARAPERHFPEGIACESPQALDRVVLERRRSPVRLARAYGLPLKELAGLNPAWTTRAVRRGYALPVGTVVWLPEGTLAAAPAGGTGVVYEVRRGDTLSGIAAAHGSSVAELKRHNGIAAGSSLIRVGQTLRLHAGAGVEEAREEQIHVVRRGESLSKIATVYGVRLADLLLANRLTARTIIHPGQRLFIPTTR